MHFHPVFALILNARLNVWLLNLIFITFRFGFIINVVIFSGGLSYKKGRGGT
jgi:hypothetical protein